MKKFVSLVLFTALMLTCCILPANAADESAIIPRIADYSLVSPVAEGEFTTNETRVTGLITIYSLGLSKSGTTLNISASTTCIPDVVKCGFKNFVIERKKSTSSVWSEYYDYGNLYIESSKASYSATLAVESGYQYRISCKHYAKKSLLVTENISNTSNIVTV